jgi:hypothetical protein
MIYISDTWRAYIYIVIMNLSRLFHFKKETGINKVIIHQPLRHTIPAMDCVVLYKIFGLAMEADVLSATTGTQYT